MKKDFKILHLTLKKKWFNMIASGDKKEEYREMKPYWINRLAGPNDDCIQWDYIIFKNGYSGAAPLMSVKCEGVTIGKGKYEWGAETGKEYFVFRLGDITRHR